jgi:hypothetical protein
MGVAKSAALRRWGKLVARLAVGLLSLGAGWLALTIHPEPLFAYSLRRDNVTLYARRPFPPQAKSILADAVQRIERSPLYDPAREQHAFLCNSEALYSFLVPHTHGSGKTNPFGNVFLRGADVAFDRVRDRQGQPKQPPRTLAYFIAHELTHALSIDRFGLGFQRLSPFQKEGYADYVAREQPVSLRAGRDALNRGALEMDPTRSGLYDRYRLLVAYELQRRGLSVEQLLGQRLEQRDVEAELRADPGL